MGFYARYGRGPGQVPSVENTPPGATAVRGGRPAPIDAIPTLGPVPATWVPNLETLAIGPKVDPLLFLSPSRITAGAPVDIVPNDPRGGRPFTVPAQPAPRSTIAPAGGPNFPASLPTREELNRTTTKMVAADDAAIRAAAHAAEAQREANAAIFAARKTSITASVDPNQRAQVQATVDAAAAQRAADAAAKAQEDAATAARVAAAAASAQAAADDAARNPYYPSSSGGGGSGGGGGGGVYEPPQDVVTDVQASQAVVNTGPSPLMIVGGLAGAYFLWKALKG